MVHSDGDWTIFERSAAWLADSINACSSKMYVNFAGNLTVLIRQYITDNKGDNNTNRPYIAIGSSSDAASLH